MKKVFLFASLVLASAVLFTSCKDDKNDDKDKTTLAESVEGTYDVKCDISLGDGPALTEGLPTELKITKTADNKIKLELIDFTISGQLASDLTVAVSDLTLGGELDNVTIDYTGKIGLTDSNDGEGSLTGSYDSTIKGSIVKRATKAAQPTDIDEIQELKLKVTVSLGIMEVAIDLNNN